MGYIAQLSQLVDHCSDVFFEPFVLTLGVFLSPSMHPSNDDISKILTSISIILQKHIIIEVIYMPENAIRNINDFRNYAKIFDVKVDPSSLRYLRTASFQVIGNNAEPNFNFPRQLIFGCIVIIVLIFF
jgi:hypothetical protein